MTTKKQGKLGGKYQTNKAEIAVYNPIDGPPEDVVKKIMKERNPGLVFPGDPGFKEPSPRRGARVGYTVFIKHYVLQCRSCKTLFPINLETLYSRGTKDIADMGNVGQVTVASKSYHCPHYLEHGPAEYIHKIRDNEKQGLHVLCEEKCFLNRQTWLQHLKDFYKSGFMVLSRSGYIGREELPDAVIKGMGSIDMSSVYDNMPEGKCILVFGRRVNMTYGEITDKWRRQRFMQSDTYRKLSETFSPNQIKNIMEDHLKHSFEDLPYGFCFPSFLFDDLGPPV